MKPNPRAKLEELVSDLETAYAEALAADNTNALAVIWQQIKELRGRLRPPAFCPAK
jgi:hypothetical protein